MTTQALPLTTSELSTAAEVSKLIASRFASKKSCLLIRYGDTSGRVIARPRPSTEQYSYLKSFLGDTVTADQIEFLASHIEESVQKTDVIGIRSDLLGPHISDEILFAPDDTIRERLFDIYPIREYARTRLEPDGARRLAQTRKAMELFRIPTHALITDAWIHVSLAESGFLIALMRAAPSFGIVTSSERKNTIQTLAQEMRGRIRYFECPCYPVAERQWAGDHSYLWDRWNLLVDSVKPRYSGEPLFISAGIWTKVIAPKWASLGGIALDVGSTMDYLEGAATRPTVLASRYGNPKEVPWELSLEAQLARRISLDEFFE